MKGIKVRQYVDLLFTVIACIGTNFIHILARTYIPIASNSTTNTNQSDETRVGSTIVLMSLVFGTTAQCMALKSNKKCNF